MAIYKWEKQAKAKYKSYTDPTGEIAVEKSGCIAYCTPQEAAAKS
jgi:hypothetical protein